MWVQTSKFKVKRQGSCLVGLLLAGRSGSAVGGSRGRGGGGRGLPRGRLSGCGAARRRGGGGAVGRRWLLDILAAVVGAVSHGDGVRGRLELFLFKALLKGLTRAPWDLGG